MLKSYTPGIVHIRALVIYVLVVLLISAIAGLQPAAAEPNNNNTIPTTPSGQPSLQGNWVRAFVTFLERPPTIESLVIPPPQAPIVANAILQRIPEVRDPQMDFDGVNQLVKVKGEYRSSIIIDPADGRMPLTEEGKKITQWARMRQQTLFDHPEQRPLPERCLESMAHAPIRSLPIILPITIIQTRDHIVLNSEGPDGLRIIHFQDRPPPHTQASVSGYSIARWAGETLVVTTNHLRADDPIRFNLPAIPISANTKITERFTRVSMDELVYRYTVEDSLLYTQAWSGEFSFTYFDGPTFEYACHEGNYSMAGVLKGGQLSAANTVSGE